MPQAQGVGGTDAFRVYSTNTSSYSNLTAFPFYVITKHEEDAQPAKPNAIGLGPNSTFLDAMWRSGNIPGHGFGLEMGVYTWPKQDRLNTEIVFGGYNKNKIDGTVYEQDILYKNMEDPTRGALVVTVVDIALDVGKGEGPVSVFTKLSENKNTTQGQKDLAFEAQLETRVPWLEFPSEIAEKIRAMGNFTWDDQAKGYTKVPSGFAGTLTVRLSNGLEVKLDTDLFSRAWNHSSATMSPLRVYKNFPLASGSAFPTLGSRFMAAVYTMVNYETKDLALGRAGTLRLAKLNKGANSSEQDFVSFCAPIPPAGHGTNNTETIDPDTTDGPGGAEKTENSKKKTPSKGVIIGAAVGGVAFIILVALLFKVFHRRRSTQTFATPLMELYGSDGHRGGQMQPHTQEFPAGAPPVEMYFDNSEYYPKPSPGELPVKEYVHPVYTEETIAQTREMSSLRSPPPQGRF
ncbi:hypothetical protein DFH27DRAFT_388446 [Peziza echinospora]|nr:hypothetical protein DFH27DRAFT_388446 [Peziza echinospora]